MLNRAALQLTPDERHFWRRWVWLTSVAFICFALPLPPILTVGLAGLCIGALQSFVLRHEVTWSIHWIWTSAIASPLLFVAMQLMGDIDSTPLPALLYLILNYLFLGAAIGFMQWLVLRRHVQRAGWWVFASAASYVFSYLVMGAILFLVESLGFLSVSVLIRLLFFVSMGLLVGALTGVVLVLLLRSPHPAL